MKYGSRPAAAKGSDVRKITAGCIGLIAAAAAGSVSAEAAGCAAMNSGAFNQEAHGTLGALGSYIGPYHQFDVGDKITLVSVYVPGAGSIPDNSVSILEGRDGSRPVTITGGGTSVLTVADVAHSEFQLIVAAGVGAEVVSTTTTATCVAAPAPVPTLSEWAMILFAAVLAGGAALLIHRRRVLGA